MKVQPTLSEGEGAKKNKIHFDMKKEQLTRADYESVAVLFGCEVEMIMAVAEVESLGAGFDDRNLPVILFERHIFSRLTNRVFDKVAPDLSNKVPGGYGDVKAQHERLNRAVKLNRDAALQSASWGKFQLMGFNYKVCGYATLQDFINSMYGSEKEQLQGFMYFIDSQGLDSQLRARDFAGFAKVYNGKDYKRNKYDVKLEAAYLRLAPPRPDPK